jgi:glycosyltransferase involved in cell wall biosynthesis
VSPEKIVVIHDCVSPKIKYTPAPFNSMKPDILQVGTAHNKNLENVIPAIAGLPVRLTILGHLLEHQRQLLEEYRIEYDNYFNLKFEEVIERYRQADLVMFASKYEGFGLPVVEANMIGRPIITSNVASLPEIAGDAALMVDPSDVSQIREAVLRIINDPSLREDLIAKGRKNVERFQPGFIANEYAKLYEKVTNRTQSH